MTFHLTLGGVKLPNRKQVTKWLKKATKTKAFGQIVPKVAMAGILLGTLPVNAVAVNSTQAYTLLDYNAEQSTLTFDVNQAFPVVSVQPTALSYELAESKADEAARKEREAKATAQTLRTTSFRVAATADPGYAFKHELVLRAAAAYGIPWEILEAVWTVESGMSWDRQVSSSAGAQGPAQFMPGTWRAYGVDADGDGVRNINGAVDAIHGAANYLAKGGADRGEIYQALWNYNHADWYVQKVLRVAREIGYTG